jgi:hypothetical protein
MRQSRSTFSLWINTMNRCPAIFHSFSATGAGRRAALLTLGLALTGLAAPLRAQIQPRTFPAKALRGTLVVTQAPAISLDGKAARLSPGSRIRGANNMLVLSGSVVGQELLVNYTLEHHGLVHDVWILTEAEAAEKRKRAGE